MLQPRPGASRISSKQRPPIEARVRGDRMLLQRALTNLLSNAVRYSPDGSEIGVRISREAAWHDGQINFTLRIPDA